MNASKEIDQTTLDLRGLKCPLPAIRTQKALQSMTVDQTVLILTTDPLAMIDVPHAAELSGGRVILKTDYGHYQSFEISKISPS